VRAHRTSEKNWKKIGGRFPALPVADWELQLLVEREGVALGENPQKKEQGRPVVAILGKRRWQRSAAFHWAERKASDQ